MTDAGTPVLSLDRLAAQIADGAAVAIPADYSGVSMAATRALVRRGARDLHLIGVPVAGLQADLLIGAGCVASIETSAVTMGEFGPAPRFTAAVRQGRLRIIDATCPAIHAGLQAAEKGIPFMPLRGIVGSDLLKHHPGWKTIQNPFAEAPDPIVAVPAIRPDVALFHAPLADRAGNVWIGRRRELVTLAHAAKATLVTVERVTDDDLFANEQMAAGVIPALYVAGVAEAPRGAWPLAMWDAYAGDEAHLKRYVELAASEAGFARYLAEFVHARSAAE